ncbi:hypothetical protein GCWU000325_00303 [Alloprevotella tannerae ATCC 51259]|uniref:Uncharacterized protein n=1 Tax=Alloprevotella tannerae ATCC 51259 TaxID=626522 RepID=C9LDN1_9BACT|nr:hypothetical protein GCWU000325_00303 [Alloprevotella tannerae ATCC 51259]
MKNTLFAINSQPSAGFSVVFYVKRLFSCAARAVCRVEGGIAARANHLPTKASRFFACVASERVYRKFDSS